MAAPTGPPPPRRHRRWWLAVAALALAGLIVSAVLLLPRADLLAPRPQSTVAGGDDSSPSPALTAGPSATPSPSPSNPTPGTPCPVGLPARMGPPPADGRVHGGPVSFALLPDTWAAPTPTNRFPYSHDGQVQTQRLPEELPWQASAEVGLLQLDEGVTGPQVTARLLDCLTASDFYTSVNVRVTQRRARRVTISGTAADRLDARLEFRHPQLQTTGSDIRIIVVATEPVSYYFHAVPRERTDLTAELDAATASLRVD